MASYFLKRRYSSKSKIKSVISLSVCMLISLSAFFYLDVNLFQRRYNQLPLRESLAGILRMFKTDSIAIEPTKSISLAEWHANILLLSKMAKAKQKTSSKPSKIPIDQTIVHSTGFLTCDWSYEFGLGNRMFQYASLIGLAKQLNREPIIVASDHMSLEEVFDLKIRRIGSTISWINFGEMCNSCYTPKRYTILQRDKSWSLTGYLQNYQYFSGIRSEIIRQFAFKNKTVVEATKRRAQIIEDYCPKGTITNCILIGVHIRRGDYLNRNSVAAGYKVADESYILNSVQWFQQHFANSTRVFVVLGNDFEWSSNTFRKYVDDNFVVLKPTSADGDLCLLSITNHTIMTAGTYGFWAGYLAGGNVTYLKNFSRKGSRLAASMKDFSWPSEWIGL